MKWSEICIRVESKDLEAAVSVATAVSSGGLYIEDYSDMLEMLPLVGRYDGISEHLLDSDTGFSVVHIYLSAEDSTHEAIAFIRERLLSEFISFELKEGTVDETDWAENWKRYYRPQKIGRRLVICPSWEEYVIREGEVVVTLDPGMSFGTGDHESTRLCLEFLEEMQLDGCALLDIGTGSGILGVAALKLGAASVTAVDVDPFAAKRAKENAALNGVEDRFEVIDGDANEQKTSRLMGGDFDIITANVVADFHIATACLYFDKLKSGGLLIASGIVNRSVEKVKDSLTAPGFQGMKTKEQNEWVAVFARKP